MVPINKKWPIKELLSSLEVYPGVNNSRRITFEYIMLDGVNDSINDAKKLVKLLKPIHAKVNLIPFNPWPVFIDVHLIKLLKILLMKFVIMEV